MSESSDLPILVAQAIKAHGAVKGAYLSALKHAREAGSAVVGCRHLYEAANGKGGWIKWAMDHIAIAPSTRDLYVMIATRWDEVETLSDDIEVETIEGRLLTNLSNRAQFKSSLAVENGSAQAVVTEPAAAVTMGDVAAGLPLSHVAEDDPDAFVVHAERVIRTIGPANVPAERRDALVPDLRALQLAVTDALAKLGA